MNGQLDLFGDNLPQQEPKPKPKPKPKPPPKDTSAKERLEQVSKTVLPATGRKALQPLLDVQFDKRGGCPNGLDSDLHRAYWELILFGHRGLIWAFAKDGLMWFDKGGNEVHYTDKDAYPESELMQLTERDCKIIKWFGLEPYEYMTKTKEVWKDIDYEFLKYTNCSKCQRLAMSDTGCKYCGNV